MTKREKVTIWVVLGVIISLGLLILASSSHLLWGSNENEFDEIISVTAQKYQVEPLLIKAIIKRESNFKYYVRGGKGEIGLMQLMPGAIQDWERIHKKSVADFEVFLPALNIEIGTWYFSQAYKKWSKSPYSISYALAEYNAGGGNLRKWIKEYGHIHPEKVIRFPSTLAYSKKIIGFYNTYREKAGLAKYVENKVVQKKRLSPKPSPKIKVSTPKAQTDLKVEKKPESVGN